VALPISYNARNLKVRWQVTLLAVFGIALVVTVFVVITAMSVGFRIALRSTGRTDNAIVVQKGSQSELTSGIPLDQANALMVDSRVARGSKGQPLASPEIVVVANLPRTIDGAEASVLVRGVRPVAFEVRAGIHPVAGRAFTPGLNELMVGERVRERFGLEPGSTVVLQRRDWSVVGVFASEGSGFESEIWGDLDAMAPVFGRTGGFQSLTLRLSDPSSLEAFTSDVDENPRLQVEMHQERRYYEAQAGTVARALMGLSIFVSVVMGIGAVFGAMNTMYAIVAARTREIGTLRALGFSRGSILVSFVTESIFLALVGGALGCVLALPANGITSATGGPNFAELAFAFRITPFTLGAGMAFAAVMGVFGGLLPAIRAARLPISSALREA
jgi:putative ABC transport system permease protein